MTATNRLVRRDIVWEALVHETAANPAMERGAINKSLKAIREAALMEGIASNADLAAEITRRAEAYRRAFVGCALTPTALAKHWRRVLVPQQNGDTSAHDVWAIAQNEVMTLWQ